MTKNFSYVVIFQKSALPPGGEYGWMQPRSAPTMTVCQSCDFCSSEAKKARSEG